MKAAVASAVLLLALCARANAARQWVGTWEAAPAANDAKRSFAGQTLREVLHVSAGGGFVRVRVSNTFGDAPLQIGRATVALRGAGASADGAPRSLTFGDSHSIIVPPHAQAFSDAATLTVPAQSDVLVSLYVLGPAAGATVHPLALQTNYVAAGDRTADANGAAFSPLGTSWYFVSGLDVAGSPATRSVVAFGDSITDGARSRTDENGRWPDDLARRLPALAPGRRLGVLNAGISGNRVLLDGGMFGMNALARFDRDVLAQTGVKDVIVLIGINDIQQAPQQNDPAAIEAGLRQLALAAHEHGLRIFGCTMLPYEGWLTYSSAGEAARAAVNRFILTSRVFDDAIDFDRLVRDPADPHRMLPAYDGGDHLHPNAAGLRLMASAIPLAEL